MSKLEAKYGKTKTCSKCGQCLPVSCFGFANKKKLQLRGDCKSCRNKVSSKWYENNKESRKKTINEWRSKNKEKYLAKCREWQLDNPKKVKNYQKKWYYNNLEKISLKHYRRKQAVPSWLTDFHKKQIKAIYDKNQEYRSQGFDFHVDHIIPINGKNVSGLHVPWNLRITTAEYNLKKNNKLEQVGVS